MSIFESIKNAIFGHGTAARATPDSAGSPAAGSPVGAVAQTPPAGPASAANMPPPAAAATTPLSHEALATQLAQLSAKNSQKLNWQTSIVDLMKLVGLDPSFANRKQLAQELGYTGDTADSASMNSWLHKAVMDKLAASGGTVPPGLKTA